MTNNPIAPPRKKIKKTKKPPSFSSIPDDVIVNTLAQISKSHYRSLSLVSKHFNSLLSSPDIYFARSLIGNTDARLYVCLWLPTPSSSHRHRWFNLSYSQGQLTLVPVRRALSSSYSPDRLNSTTVAVQSEIYQMGGSNEDKRTRAVRVLDCRSHTWRRAPDMKVARKHARSYFLDEKIYVIGGCTQTEEAMTWGEVFDLKTQTWKPLPKPPSDGRITGPWCDIGSVIFAERDRKFMWYDSRNGKWLVVDGLGLVYCLRAKNSRTIQLVNHAGKLVIIWDKWHMRQREHKSVWCAVVSFEKRLFPSSNMWGKVEQCNVVLGLAHKSYKLSSCLSVLV
ncbi:hypothetical protein DY000_02036525 [Brassica cretica]|uniref:F-box domain-containing protein n=1 Tax=Brassica cretica TaxID=69181 RepID=A0ABQ7BQ71_BRACR|nr:hypothetical protein DY000_02036525 [Brassica cretica]